MLSAGVESKESYISSTIVQSATGRGATVGKFNWGPAFQISTIVSEVDLVNRFYMPDDYTAESFMTANNFLQYANDLRLVRIVNETVAKNATATYNSVNVAVAAGGTGYAVDDALTIKRQDVTVETTGRVTSVNADGQILTVFIPTGKIIDAAIKNKEYPTLTQDWTVSITSGSGVGATIKLDSINADSSLYIPNDDFAYNSLNEPETDLKKTFLGMSQRLGTPTIAARYIGEYGNNIQIIIVSYADFNKNNGSVDFINYPSGTKSTINMRSYLQFGLENENQYGIIVRRGTEVLEQFILSTAKEKDMYGKNINIDEFFKNGKSIYLQGSTAHWPAGFSGILSLNGGYSGNDRMEAGSWIKGWDSFSDREGIDVNLMMGGSVCDEGVTIASTVQKHVVAIADSRMDALAIISPPKDIMIGRPVDAVIDDILNWRNAEGDFEEDNMNISSTYATIDGNYKFQYDKYNDVNRWVSFSGDIAGLCARTDVVAQVWNSPAGYNRGRISNVIKLAIEPRQTHRDSLYVNGINPITGSTMDGYILYGDKTATRSASPFDRINVRRLFNMLKRSIGKYARSKLFETNNNFTRLNFRSEVNSYFENIQALGGTYEYRVICDETNNTTSVIDRNEFVGTMYVKPSRSINFITLNFVATDTSVNFDEIIGAQTAA